GLDVLDHGIEGNGYRALIGVVGLDRELSAQLPVRSPALESNRNAVFLARLDGLGGGDDRGSRTGDVQHLDVAGTRVGEPEDAHDVLAAMNDSEGDLRRVER